MIDVLLTHEPIKVAEITNAGYQNSCGAVTTFIGTVRNLNKNREVSYLDFEAFEPMALKELRKIAEHCTEKWDVQHLSVAHRLGRVGIGEEAVLIVVTTEHRKAGFEACEYVIDTLKQTVPIWKKEVYATGAEWVSAHP